METVGPMKEADSGFWKLYIDQMSKPCNETTGSIMERLVKKETTIGD